VQIAVGVFAANLATLLVVWLYRRKRMNLFMAVWKWTLREDWRTWASHSLLAIVATLIVGELGGLHWAGAFGVWVFYLGREWGQVENEMSMGTFGHAKVGDHFMDAALPIICSGLTGVVLGWA
jgi:hypothetical protein